MNQALKALERLRSHAHDNSWKGFDDLDKALKAVDYVRAASTGQHRATWSHVKGADYTITASEHHSSKSGKYIKPCYIRDAREKIESILNDFPELLT